MKKVFIGMLAVGLVIGFAFTAFSAEVKEKTTVKGDKVTTKTTVKGDKVKMKSTETTSAKGESGKTKIKVKDGALKKLNIEWVYYKQGTEYILEYKIKDKADPDLKAELGLTDEQYRSLKPGKHTYWATRDILPDAQDNFRTIILRDLMYTYKN